MSWFKVILLVTFGLDAIVRIAQSGGWRPELKDWAYAGTAVLDTLIFIGIWLWV